MFSKTDFETAAKRKSTARAIAEWTVEEDLAARPDPSAHEMAIRVVHAPRAHRRRHRRRERRSVNRPIPCATSASTDRNDELPSEPSEEQGDGSNDLTTISRVVASDTDDSKIGFRFPRLHRGDRVWP